MRLCANEVPTVYEVTGTEIEDVLHGLSVGLSALHDKGYVSVDITYHEGEYNGIAYVH